MVRKQTRHLNQYYSCSDSKLIELIPVAEASASATYISEPTTGTVLVAGNGNAVYTYTRVAEAFKHFNS
jgi:hypothetical protein